MSKPLKAQNLAANEDLEMSFQAIKAGTPFKQFEFAISCFCCRDAAIIPPDTVRKYFNPRFDDMRPFPDRPDAPVLCTRETCNANWQWVVNASGHSMKVRKYNPELLNATASPDECESIHWTEMSAEVANPSAVRSAIQEAADAIVESHPILSDDWSVAA